jgi:hypothetical protein
VNTTEGRLLPVLANAPAAFRHAPEWGGVLAFNCTWNKLAIAAGACGSAGEPPVIDVGCVRFLRLYRFRIIDLENRGAVEGNL